MKACNKLCASSDDASAVVDLVRGVVVNFDLGDGFRDLGPSNGGACAPAHGVSVLEVGAGGGRPLPLRRFGGITP